CARREILRRHDLATEAREGFTRSWHRALGGDVSPEDKRGLAVMLYVSGIVADGHPVSRVGRRVSPKVLIRTVVELGLAGNGEHGDAGTVEDWHGRACLKGRRSIDLHEVGGVRY